MNGAPFKLPRRLVQREYHRVISPAQIRGQLIQLRDLVCESGHFVFQRGLLGLKNYHLVVKACDALRGVPEKRHRQYHRHQGVDNREVP